MRIAFVIERLAHYRLFGPIIDEALRRGWDVECWHDHGRPLDGLKQYQFPSLHGVPTFAHGQPIVKDYCGRSELRTWMAADRADAVVSTETARFAGEPGQPAGSASPVWVSLQNVTDAFVTHSPASLLSCDLLALYSPWWLTWALDYYGDAGLIEDRQDYERRILARSSFVGLPETDVARGIDTRAVRARWGIPQDQPVVVFFPFPQGVGQASFWPKRLFGVPSRIRQAANVVLHRRHEYWPHILQSWNDRSVVLAIRRFCDRNGAYLLVKSRRKTPIPGYLEAVADQCLYDDSVYPATVLESLAIASLSISYYSGAVLESVALGVPHVCLAFSGNDYFGSAGVPPDFPRLYTTEEGSVFQFRGVSTALTIPDAIRGLPERGLDDFRIDAAARAAYVRTYLGFDDRDASGRLLDAVTAAVKDAHSSRLPDADRPVLIV